MLELGIKIKVSLSHLFKITESYYPFLYFSIFKPFVDKIGVLKDKSIMIANRSIDLLMFY